MSDMYLAKKRTAYNLIPGYKSLANAVIVRAVLDYRHAREFLDDGEKEKELLCLQELIKNTSGEEKAKLERRCWRLSGRISFNKRMLWEIDNFFRSGKATKFCDVSDYIYRKIKEECDAGIYKCEEFLEVF